MAKATIFKSLFIALALFVSIPSMGQTAKENGEKFIDALFSEQYDKALEYIDSSIRQQVTKDVLKQSIAEIGRAHV